MNSRPVPPARPDSPEQPRLRVNGNVLGQRMRRPQGNGAPVPRPAVSRQPQPVAPPQPVYATPPTPVTPVASAPAAVPQPAAPTFAPTPTPPAPTPTPVTFTAPVEARPEPKTRRFSLRPLVKPLVATVIVAALAAGGFFGYQTYLRPHATIPAGVKKQINFGVFVPVNKDVLIVDPAKITYNSETKVVSYTAERPNGGKITFSEQATPGSFVSDPQAFNKLITSLQVYGSLASDNGKVSLTHPSELKGSQTAVMNAQGTLLFARPNDNMSNAEWREVFNALELSK